MSVSSNRYAPCPSSESALSITNFKHNTLLRLCYGMGLRVSEIMGLKLQHIDSGNMQVHIVRGKGNRRLCELAREYLAAAKDVLQGIQAQSVPV